jgi:amphi-Trp domain-containing protein
MAYWTKMTEILENYRETHQSIFRHKTELGKEELAKFFLHLSESLREKSFDVKSLFLGSKEKSARISPTEPVALKFLYAKENHKLEIHMEIEWTPVPKR